MANQAVKNNTDLGIRYVRASAEIARLGRELARIKAHVAALKNMSVEEFLVWKDER